MTLAALKQKVPIKYFMAGYLGLFLVFSSFATGSIERLIKGLAIVALYSAFDLLWTYFKEKTWYLPTSSWISGFILSLVAAPAPPLLLLVLLPALAIFSKHVLKFGRQRHVFNPASYSMGILAFFTPAISWWGVAWGRTPLMIALLVGIFILWRQRRFHVTLPFLASYTFFLGLLFLINGVPADRLPAFLWPQIFDGTAIFFMTVMLIEPITSTFPTREHRMWYGGLVGFFAVLVSWLGGILPLQDPLIYGLLLGNLVCSLKFLQKAQILKTKFQINSNVKIPTSNL